MCSRVEHQLSRFGTRSGLNEIERAITACAFRQLSTSNREMNESNSDSVSVYESIKSDIMQQTARVSIEPVFKTPMQLENALSHIQKEKVDSPKRLRQLGKSIIQSLKLKSLSKHRGGIQPNFYDPRTAPHLLRGSKRQLEKQALKALTLDIFRADAMDPENLDILIKSNPKYEILRATADRSHYESQSKHLGPKLYNGLGALAYATARLPSTYAAIKNVMKRLKQSAKTSWEPRTILDFGAGPGTAAWAAQSVWPSSTIQVTAVEASSSMANLGYEIMNLCSQRPNSDQSTSETSVQQHNEGYNGQSLDIRWGPYFPRDRKRLTKFDVCIAAYSLNELHNDVQRHQVLNKLMHSSQKYIILIEPGTPHGFSIIEDSRRYILKVSRKLGIPYHVVAPCPHDGPCPLAGARSWCHFSQRHFRTEEQRIAVTSLTGKAPRDTYVERFSYIILERGLRDEVQGSPVLPDREDGDPLLLAGYKDTNDAASTEAMGHTALPYSTTLLKNLLKVPNSRILRSRKRKGHVILDLCSVLDDQGAFLGKESGTIIRQTVSRRSSKASWDNGSMYKDSKALQPGDQWPLLYQAGSKSIEAPIVKAQEHSSTDDHDHDESDDEWLQEMEVVDLLELEWEPKNE